jgi:hypothetical protein
MQYQLTLAFTNARSESIPCMVLAAKCNGVMRVLGTATLVLAPNAINFTTALVRPCSQAK